MNTIETKSKHEGTENTVLDTSDELVSSSDPLHPANLIPELCKAFYHLGWVTGTGGGISIRDDEKVFIAPSGVQKERIQPSHIFVLPYPQKAPYNQVLRKPAIQLNQSACTPLFWAAYDIRGAYACIHTHSQHAVMTTLLWPGDCFRVSGLEMIKGVRWGGVDKTMSYLDELVIPIIENTPHEEDLRDSMAQAMKDNPKAAAILVRRHGVYVWGPTWESAKTQAECLDYLFEVAVKMRQAGIDTDWRPPQ